MKKLVFLLGIVVVPCLAGCVGASPPAVALKPVGPNPNSIPLRSSMGSLEVFSLVTQQAGDQNIGGTAINTWPRYTGYQIYTLQGRPMEHVFNGSGVYGEGPEKVNLPPGQYLVKAQAENYFWVKVPVTIQPGRTTMVHLDGDWNPPFNTPKKELVTLPDGNPVGWTANLPEG